MLALDGRVGRVPQVVGVEPLEVRRRRVVALRVVDAGVVVAAGCRCVSIRIGIASSDSALDHSARGGVAECAAADGLRQR